jgi:hypothetical protein
MITRYGDGCSEFTHNFCGSSNFIDSFAFATQSDEKTSQLSVGDPACHYLAHDCPHYFGTKVLLI